MWPRSTHKKKGGKKENCPLSRDAKKYTAMPRAPADRMALAPSRSCTLFLLCRQRKFVDDLDCFSGLSLCIVYLHGLSNSVRGVHRSCIICGIRTPCQCHVYVHTRCNLHYCHHHHFHRHQIYQDNRDHVGSILDHFVLHGFYLQDFH